MAKLCDTDKQKIQSCYGIVFLLDWNNPALGGGRGPVAGPNDLIGHYPPQISMIHIRNVVDENF